MSLPPQPAVATSRLPSWFGSIKTRLAVLYSTLVFGLVGLLVSGIYFGVSRSLAQKPIPGVVVDLDSFCMPARAGGFYCFRGEDGQATVELNGSEAAREIQKAASNRALQQFRRYSFWSLAFLFLASVGIGWLLAERALRPIGRITRVARRIGATDLTERIQLVGPRDELSELADTFDEMLGRVEMAFESQRSFIHEASHELRNPIAVIRTNVEVALADATPSVGELHDTLAVVGRTAERMTVLVDDLLTYARREAPAVREDLVDVGGLIRETGAEFAAPAEARNLRLAIDGPADLWVNGDVVALKQALANLVANAVRLVPSPSTIRLAAGRDGTWIWLAVADEGPGIAPEEQAKVWDRFWRGETNRGRSDGRSGLGLTIVRQIARGHGGSVGLQSKLGGGSTFSIWLPAVPSSHELRPAREAERL